MMAPGFCTLESLSPSRMTRARFHGRHFGFKHAICLPNFFNAGDVTPKAYCEASKKMLLPKAVVSTILVEQQVSEGYPLEIASKLLAHAPPSTRNSWMRTPESDCIAVSTSAIEMLFLPMQLVLDERR